MAWKFCTSGSAIAAAGTNANATIVANSATLALWSNQAEGRIEQETNTDYTTTYTDLSTSMKNALADVSASKIAKMIVVYDPTGYLTREADLLMNMNDDVEIKGLAALKGKPDKLKAP